MSFVAKIVIPIIPMQRFQTQHAMGVNSPHPTPMQQPTVLSVAPLSVARRLMWKQLTLPEAIVLRKARPFPLCQCRYSGGSNVLSLTRRLAEAEVCADLE